MNPLTPHELECALAAIAARIERAETAAEKRKWRAFLKSIERGGA